MNRIVEILMKRDGMSRKDAEELVADTREELENCGGSYDAAEDIMQNNLGLEMDYIFDLCM